MFVKLVRGVYILTGYQMIRHFALSLVPHEDTRLRQTGYTVRQDQKRRISQLYDKKQQPKIDNDTIFRLRWLHRGVTVGSGHCFFFILSIVFSNTLKNSLLLWFLLYSSTTVYNVSGDKDMSLHSFMSNNNSV